MMKTDFLIVMGVSGCGKTSIGKALAANLGWGFYDGDDFHPPANIEKMAAGIPLDDIDRAPWLAALYTLIQASLQHQRPAVLACSALKESYRRALTANNLAVKFIYLKGDYELIWARMASRPGHYMKPEMLRSQFASLEEPRNALVVDISASQAEIVDSLLMQLKTDGMICS